jgi:hypothetical protein
MNVEAAPPGSRLLTNWCSRSAAIGRYIARPVQAPPSIGARQAVYYRNAVVPGYNPTASTV